MIKAYKVSNLFMIFEYIRSLIVYICTRKNIFLVFSDVIG